MDIKGCYEALGGSYEDIISRIPNAALIEKFVRKFLEDENFDTLCTQMKLGDRAAAFRAAHTLKGVSANMSFTRLSASVSLLTEELRKETDTVSEEAEILFGTVCRDYEATAAAIRKYAD